MKKNRLLRNIRRIVLSFAILLLICGTALADSHPIAEAGGPYSGEIGETISFIGTSSTDPGGFVGYGVWDFGDNSPKVASLNAFHAYTNSGTFTATLLVIDNDGLTDTDEATVTIAIGNEAPTADPGDPYLATTDVSLIFDGGGSEDTDGTIVSYDWTFGDGSFGTGEMPEHTYTAVGTYTVYLEVKDDDDAIGGASTTVEVSETNYAPTADAGGPYDGEVGGEIIFYGNATDPNGNGDVVSFEWDFGDGTQASGINAFHTYDVAGSYDVKLTVKDSQGEPGVDTTSASIDVPEQPPIAVTDGPYSGSTSLAVNFSAVDSTDPDGNIVSYRWNFGDGNTGTGETTTHTYATTGQFDVILAVDDNDGLSDTNSTYAVISADNQAPIADAGGPYPGEAEISVNFTGSAQDENVGNATGEWNFGDGTPPVAGFAASHTYAANGIYRVTFTVTDEDSLKGSDRALALIGQGPQAPIARAGGPYRGKSDTVIDFYGGDSEDLDGDIVSYAWSFGDGATGTGPTPSHTYTNAEVYEVSLIVTDNDNLSSTNSTVSLIIDPNQPPTAVANGPTSGMVGEALSFDGAESTDPDGGINYVIWNFGDGTFETGLTASHTYLAGDRTYQVTMMVVDNENATDTDVITLSIDDPATVEMQIALGANPNEVVISWIPATAGFSLQEKTDLGSDTWTGSPSGTDNPVTVPTDGAAKYYRLIAP